MSRLWVFVAVVAALLVAASPAQAAAPANTVAPSISGPRDPGNPSEGDLLTANPGTWSGDEPISYAYQWYRCAGSTCPPISGATASTYTPVWNRTASLSDVGKMLRVRVTATNAFGSASIDSAKTKAVVGLTPQNTSPPTVSGWPYTGQTLTGTLGTWTENHTSPQQPNGFTINYTRQWQRCLASTGCAVSTDWSNITGATALTYTIAAVQVGYRLRLRITATSTFGAGYAYSDPIPAITDPPSPPVNTAAPIVSNAQQVGETITTTTGTWTPTVETLFTFAWQRCEYATQGCQDIAGATSPSYAIAPEDAGFKLRSRITADNGGGVSTAYSEIKPYATTAPSLAGWGNAGQTLELDEGSWRNDPSFEYRWQRCTATGANCADISGATNSTYTASEADIGHMLRGVVTASNAFGAAVPTNTPTIAILKSVENLVRDYSPKLFFDKSEQWRPLDIELFLSESFPEYQGATHHKVCKKEPGDYTTWCSEITNSGALFAADGRTYDIADRAWMQIRHEGSNGYASPRAGCVTTNADDRTVRDCNAGPESAIYYAYGQDRVGYRYLNYWFFYRFNETRYAGVGDHEGDWESVTVVLDPLDASSPNFERAIYEQHGLRKWFGVATPTTTHPYVYPASGTHASYVDQCTEDWAGPCPSPVPEAPLESDHGGQYPWGGNDCSSCLLPLEQYPWTDWKGRWGVHWDSDAIGTDSPTSIGTDHKSYTCLPDYFEPGCDRPEDFRGLQLSSRQARPQAPSRDFLPPVCDKWFGGGVVALICDPATVTKARRTRGLPIEFRATAAGHQSLVAPGISQVVGRLLRPSSVVNIEGRLPAKAQLAFTLWHKRKIYRAVVPAGNYFSTTRSKVLVSTRNGRLVLRVQAGRSTRLLPAKITIFGSGS